MILFRDVLRMDYRSIVDLREMMAGITELLELDQLPRFTTLQKFLPRIRSGSLDILLRKYTWRTGPTWRSCLKTSRAGDTQKPVITGVRISQNFVMMSSMPGPSCGDVTVSGGRRRMSWTGGPMPRVSTGRSGISWELVPSFPSETGRGDGSGEGTAGNSPDPSMRISPSGGPWWRPPSPS